MPFVFLSLYQCVQLIQFNIKCTQEKCKSYFPSLNCAFELNTNKDEAAVFEKKRSPAIYNLFPRLSGWN